MLYERWKSIVENNADAVAITDAASGRRFSFAELDIAADKLTLPDDQWLACPSGHNTKFIIQVIAAWKNNLAVLPLETDRSAPTLERVPDDVAHMKLTSGTTGSARCAIFTEQQLAADADQIVSTMRLTPDQPNLAVISLAHSYGFSNLVTPLLLHGIPLVLVSAPLPEIVRQAVVQHDAVTLPAVPAMWRAWLNAGSLTVNIRLGISAGAPLPLEIESEIHRRTGLKIHNFYGSTECGGIAYDPSNEPRNDARMIGRSMNGVELDVVDGCLSVTSRAVATGYLHGDRSRLGDGKFLTSDLAGINNGNIRLLGRESDVINIAGRKLSPETVEAVVRVHAGVRDCVVFGIPSADDARCDEVAIAIQLNLETDLRDVQRQTALKLEGWQMPRHWWVVDNFSVNNHGKISRKKLGEQFREQRA